jgi:Adenylate and Guanylate cyclase catalytic domain
MESTGLRNRIHISEESANLISATGKTHWVKMREDKVSAKGKGVMKTYWLNPSARRAGSAMSVDDGNANRSGVSYQHLVHTDSRQERLVNWVRKAIMATYYLLRQLLIVFLLYRL